MTYTLAIIPSRRGVTGNYGVLNTGMGKRMLSEGEFQKAKRLLAAIAGQSPLIQRAAAVAAIASAMWAS